MSSALRRCLAAGFIATLLVVVTWATSARAEPTRMPALDTTQLAGGVAVNTVGYLLEDEAGRLTLSDVTQPERQAAFRELAGEVSLGYTRAAYWLRFEAVNGSAQPQRWLLELGYPHIDHIDLYALSEDGRSKHWRGGDTLPFAARDIDHANFIFTQESPAHTRTRYYLRVQSSGSLRVPLHAWRTMEFMRYDSRRNLLLWMFYGAVIVMASFNLGVAALLRSREYVLQVGLLLSMGAAIFTLSGQTFQFVVPNSPMLANRALSIAMALSLYFVQVYTRQVARQYARLNPVVRLYRYSVPLSMMLIPVAMFVPTPLSQPIVFACIGLYMPFAAVKLNIARKSAEGPLRFYVLSLACLAVGMPVAILAHSKLIPPYPVAIWAAHLGFAAYAVLDALALPARINLMKEHLAGLNDQLSDKVRELEKALADSKQANDEARRATKAKDEFMATMSHELRTPLNAIINVPQGLLEDFTTARSASCRACNARFLLDGDEVVDAQTVCLDCQAVGSLVEGTTVRYEGDPTRTMRFLRKIERSGHHLLQMVNGVLDFSKMEAGRLELVVDNVDLRSLLTELVDEMSDLATRKNIRMELALADVSEPGWGDAVRIRQVLLNLLSNAIKFSEPGDTVQLAWTREAESDVITVRDQGIGIAPENHERVFASFEQVHKGDTRKYGGTGLGLSISRSLVRMHGGELWVESALGQGSLFRFTLPRPLHGQSTETPFHRSVA